MNGTSEQLRKIASGLDDAERTGTKDYPEGNSCIVMSDTLAREISALLRRAADDMDYMNTWIIEAGEMME